MLKFHIIIIKFSIFTDKNSESDTFFLKLKNIIVKIDIKSFSVYSFVFTVTTNFKSKVKEPNVDQGFKRESSFFLLYMSKRF